MDNEQTRVIRREPPEPLSPFAIISDIHANLPALTAVLEDIDRRGLKRVLCLGDVVGYGANPAECWRLVTERCEMIIRGNHDHVLGSGEMSRFHPRARNAIEWTRSSLEKEPDGGNIIRAVSNLPKTVSEGELLFVHGCPSGPTMEYLLPGDSYDRRRMAKEFALVDRFAFNGHSHIPGVIERGVRFMPPEALAGYKYQLAGRQAIINVGSVGQPRDGNPKACYVTIEDGFANYHRIQYDAEEACRRILAVKELDPFLGQRLLAGY